MWFKEWWAIISFLIIGVFIGYIIDSAGITGNSVTEPIQDKKDFIVTEAESFSWMGSSIMSRTTDGKFIKVTLQVFSDMNYTPAIVDGDQNRYYRMEDDTDYIPNAIQADCADAGAMVFEVPKDAKDLSLVMLGRAVKLDIRDTGVDSSNEQQFEGALR